MSKSPTQVSKRLVVVANRAGDFEPKIGTRLYIPVDH